MKSTASWLALSALATAVESDASAACQSASGDPIPNESITFNFSVPYTGFPDFALELLMPLDRGGAASVFGWIWDGRTSARVVVFTGQPAKPVCGDSDGDGAIGMIEARFLGHDFWTGKSVRLHVLAAGGDVDDDGRHSVLIRENERTYHGVATLLQRPLPHE